MPLRVVRGRRLIQILLPERRGVILSLKIKLVVLRILLIGGLLASSLFFLKAIMLKNLIYWSIGLIWSLPLFSGQLPLTFSFLTGKFYAYLDFRVVQNFSFVYQTRSVRNVQEKVYKLFSNNFKINLLILIIFLFFRLI